MLLLQCPELEAQFKAALYAAPDPMIISSEDGTILVVSSQFEDCFGYTRDEVVGLNILRLVPERFRRMHPQKMADFLKSPQLRRMGGGAELFAVRKDGSEFPVEISLSPLRTKKGTFIISCVRDMTSRKRVDEALIARTKELARSNAELERVAFMASHDLQEPLRMINCYLDLLEKHGRETMDTASLEFLGFARDAGRRLATMVNDLLIHSRETAAQPAVGCVDATSVMNHVLQNLQLLIDDSGAQVDCGPLPTVLGTVSSLEQVFQNMVSNAIKYRGKASPKIKIQAVRYGSEWQFCVRDNGIGIPPEYSTRIFEMFQRLHGQEIPGTGIGLATCKKIVERMGGRIWVKSRPGEGAAFYFTFPAIEEPARDAIRGLSFMPAIVDGLDQVGNIDRFG
jgi:PAS domain S-box-containing protein